MNGTTLRSIAYRLIHEAGERGMTALEVVATSGHERWGIQPRLSELVSAKAIVNSGKTRTNPSGRQAIVWVAPDYAEDYDASPFGDIAARVVVELGQQLGFTLDEEPSHG
ncbi:hypothetical protein EOE18_13175 [Novosphingobium umbonatum]|uniref:Transcriptional regulator n=2 Tax=Novosphingobium umbonatum TaxID=1908524 RepID=A0A437N2G8_9SPHN|nr:hypothetical protein EOE18_13175 [Novosphingobium umbonatum]